MIMKDKFGGLPLSSSGEWKLYWSNKERENLIKKCIISETTWTFNLIYLYSLGLGLTWQVPFIYNICAFSTFYLYVNLLVIKYARILMNLVEGLIETFHSGQTSSSFTAFASFGVVGKSSFNICPVKLLRQLDVIRWRHAPNQLAMEMVSLLSSSTLVSFLSSKRVRTRYWNPAQFKLILADWGRLVTNTHSPSPPIASTVLVLSLLLSKRFPQFISLPTLSSDWWLRRSPGV